MGDPMGKNTPREIRVAVAGQPNVGKSALFNVLTGMTATVANWPGVTIERHDGYRFHRGVKIHFTDLPGTYGFSATSLEEIIARNFILGEKPDVLLVLVDSIAPERTMYLAIEALEIYTNVIIVFTKSDLTHTYGIHINYREIEEKLNVPVVPVSVAKGFGIDELLDKIIDVARGEAKRKQPLKVDYGDLEPFIREAEKLVSNTSLVEDFPSRWLAIKLLEGDRDLLKRLEKRGYSDVAKKIGELREEIIRFFRSRPEELFSKARFNYLLRVLKDAIIRVEVQRKKYDEKIDRLFTNPVVGPLASILMLVLAFTIIFTVNTGFPLTQILETLGLTDLAEVIETYSLGSIIELFFEKLSDIVEPQIKGYPEWLQSLIIDGIIGGIGAVLVFLPLIFLVSLLLAVLEDTGLTPRIAVSLHTLFQKIGLSGHAVFPITLSLGCNVPGIMATRVTPDFRERLRLILILGFIPCQARLVVVLAFASALAGIGGLLLIILAYLVSFAVFSIVGYGIYRTSKLKEEPELLLEIPPIHRPLPKVVWWLTWNPTKHFLKKAGTVIFFATLLSWFLLYYTPALTPASEPAESIGAWIARVFEPILSPLGFAGENAWKIVYTLMIGFLAKEAIISTLTILTDTNSAIEAIEVLNLTQQQIVTLTIVSILYVPCLATLAAIYLESRIVKIAVIATLLMLAVAYVTGVISYAISLVITTFFHT